MLPLSRRDLLKTSALLGLGAVLAACGGAAGPVSSQASAPSSAAPAASAPASSAKPSVAASPSSSSAVAAASAAGAKDVLHVAYASLQPNFDPHNWGGSSGVFTFAPMYDALTVIDADGQLKPALATSWSLANPTTWQFKLRPGVPFQNGDPFSADDVVFSYSRILDVNNKLVLLPMISTIEKVVAVDGQTVNVITKAPDPILPRRASFVYVVPAKYFSQLGPQKFVQQAVGTGSWGSPQYEKDRKLYFKAFPKSWRGAPKEQELRIDVIGDTAPRMAALRSGEVDVAVNVDADQVKNLQSSGLSVQSKPIGRIQAFQFDMKGPLGNQKVRQAFNMAIDRQSIVNNVLQGLGAVPDGQLVGPGATGYNPDLKGYAYDPAGAKQMLAEAGYASGFDTQLEVLDLVRTVAEAAAGYLSKVGIQMKLQVIDFATFADHVQKGTRGPVFMAASDYGLLMDADQAYFMYSSVAPAASRYADDPQFNDLFARSRAELDAAKREQILHDLAATWKDKALGVPVFQWSGIVAMAKNVSGVQIMPNGSWGFDHAVKA